jgi:hypothetical protein
MEFIHKKKARTKMFTDQAEARRNKVKEARKRHGGSQAPRGPISLHKARKTALH